MDLFTELNELMVKYRFRSNKKMAQLFMVDEEVIAKLIKEAELSPDDTVLEIGAGAGFLTRELQKKCRVIAVELDKALFHLLESELPKKNLELVHGNILKVQFGKANKVVALPPYKISAGIMNLLFDIKPLLCVMILQREFVEKLMAQPGFLNYNAMSVLTQYYFGVEMLARVPPGSFFPRPKVESAIVKLSLSQAGEMVFDENLFRLFVKSIFRFQNKNIANAVKNSLQFLGQSIKSREGFIEKVASHRLAGEKVNRLSCKELVQLFNEVFGK